jgi:hypothetical protein
MSTNHTSGYDYEEIKITDVQEEEFDYDFDYDPNEMYYALQAENQ